MAGHPPEQSGEEFSEFLFGPNPREDGSVPSGDEEKRRQDALRYHAEQLAKKHGIEMSSKSVRPATPLASTPRAANIEELAKVTMPEADAKAKTRIARGKIELPDGTKASKTFIELGFLDNLSDALKAVASPFSLLEAAGSLAKRVLRISMKVGPFRGSAKFDKEPDPTVVVTGRPGKFEMKSGNVTIDQVPPPPR